ncbi:MAG: hypothetical protein CVV27_12525 [Candidatus Melainabacteria bacterium HGW-Melainabacteria-1]|nr:MAG: hypothetical protein CVV27_12525 [Candidatus Melainabacteria bacterium HGW-Melainabacteria-1]
MRFRGGPKGKLKGALIKMLKKWLAGMFQPELDSLKAEYEQKLTAQNLEHERSLQAAQAETDRLCQELELLAPLKEQITRLEAEALQLRQQLESQANSQTADQQQQSILQAELDSLRAQLVSEAAARQAAEQQAGELETRRQHEIQALQAQIAERAASIEALEAEKTRMMLRSQLNPISAPTAQQPDSAAAAVATVVAPALEQNDGLIRPPVRSRKKVLIVDDAATTRILQKNMLESAGYEVVMGNDGQQGQSLLAEHLPDLVITDIEMPRMNGFELTTWIKQSAYREVPVLMVTSHSDDSFQQKGLSAGADGFVEKKSFNQKTFLEIIQHYV